MEINELAVGTRVTMDAEKFPKLRGLVYLVDEAPRVVEQGTEQGWHFVWIVVEGTEKRSPSRRRVRSAWTHDLRPAPEV